VPRGGIYIFFFLILVCEAICTAATPGLLCQEGRYKHITNNSWELGYPLWIKRNILKSRSYELYTNATDLARPPPFCLPRGAQILFRVRVCVNGAQTGTHNEKLLSVWPSPNVTTAIRVRHTWWAGYVACAEVHTDVTVTVRTRILPSPRFESRLRRWLSWLMSFFTSFSPCMPIRDITSIRPRPLPSRPVSHRYTDWAVPALRLSCLEPITRRTKTQREPFDSPLLLQMCSLL
jgi:hypothetical protein